MILLLLIGKFELYRIYSFTSIGISKIIGALFMSYLNQFNNCLKHIQLVTSDFTLKFSFHDSIIY